MARRTERLTALQVSQTKKPGLYADGAGLYLQVAAGGSKSWLWRFMLAGRARWMGLGSYPAVALADARAQAADARRLRLAGVDPIEARKAARAQSRIEAARAITFKDAADKYIAAHKPGWRNARHAAQWASSLETYARPVLGSLPVQAIDVGLVLKVLEPIWTEKSETASRLRGRIEAVLDWAAARGYRLGENPARWRGHLENLLPARAKVRKVRHHPALPYAEVGAFVAVLRQEGGLAARALEFLILTACRTGEAIGACWPEFDPDGAVWTIPAERTKMGRAHRVPLSPPALALLKGLVRPTAEGGFVFPGADPDRPLSNMAMLALLKRMGRDDLTAHGFRSTFRDWAAERTNYPREVAEMALGHAIGDRVEAAYRRGDLFEKRRRLMAAWGEFCGTVPEAGKVLTYAPRGARSGARGKNG